MDEFIKSSGNVFADLGLPNAEERLAKAELVKKIDQIIQKRRLTQHQAAKILGIAQPKASELLRAKLSGFSMDRLLNFLINLDQDIKIRVKSKPCRARRRAKTKVV